MAAALITTIIQITFRQPSLGPTNGAYKLAGWTFLISRPQLSSTFLYSYSSGFLGTSFDVSGCGVTLYFFLNKPYFVWPQPSLARPELFSLGSHLAGGRALREGGRPSTEGQRASAPWIFVASDSAARGGGGFEALFD